MRNVTLSFFCTVLENRQIITALRLKTLKGFEYGRTGFGEEERRKKEGEKKKLWSAERRQKKAHRWSRQDWIINKTFPKCFLQHADGSETHGNACSRFRMQYLWIKEHIYIEGQLFFRVWISSCFYIALVLQGTTRCKSTKCLLQSVNRVMHELQIIHRWWVIYKICISLRIYLQS